MILCPECTQQWHAGECRPSTTTRRIFFGRLAGLVAAAFVPIESKAWSGWLPDHYLAEGDTLILPDGYLAEGRYGWRFHDRCEIAGRSHRIIRLTGQAQSALKIGRVDYRARRTRDGSRIVTAMPYVPPDVTRPFRDVFFNYYASKFPWGVR